MAADVKRAVQKDEGSDILTPQFCFYFFFQILFLCPFFHAYFYHFINGDFYTTTITLIIY